MSTLKPPDQALCTALAGHTGRPAMLIEVDADAVKPYFLVTPLPSGDWAGALGDPNSLADLPYQVDVVGSTQEQAGKAEERMLEALTLEWVSMPTVMGPPVIRRNGAVREDDRTFKITYTIILKAGN